jgi:hypothetical protein
VYVEAALPSIKGNPHNLAQRFIICARFLKNDEPYTQAPLLSNEITTAHL